MIRGGTIKSKNFPDKVRLSEYIRTNWEIYCADTHPSGIYWNGKFKQPITGKLLFIHFQYYAKGSLKVDYIDMCWCEGKTYGKALRSSTIYELIEKYNIKNILNYK